MKTLRLILLGAVGAGLLAAPDVQAQIRGARSYTKRIAPQTGQTNAPGVRPAPAPLQAPSSVATPPPAAASAKPLTAPVPVHIVQPYVDPEKARASKEEALRKTVEFQKKRAEEGSESAQYQLGVRYLKGDGVEKDPVAGRKWLFESSKNGYGPATQKLEELDKPATAGKSEKAAEKPADKTDRPQKTDKTDK